MFAELFSQVEKPISQHIDKYCQRSTIRRHLHQWTYRGFTTTTGYTKLSMRKTHKQAASKGGCIKSLADQPKGAHAASTTFCIDLLKTIVIFKMIHLSNYF